MFLYQKRGLQPWNCLIVNINAKEARRNSAGSLPHRELFTQRISGFSDSRFLCCHLVEIEDVITPHDITLFKHKSWTEKRISRRQKCRYFEDIFFSFLERTQINSKRGVFEVIFFSFRERTQTNSKRGVFEVIFFSFRGGTQINSKRGVVNK